MALVSTITNSGYKAVVVGQILLGSAFPDVSLTANTAAQAGQAYRESVRVYHSAFGSFPPTANTALIISHRPTQTDVGLSPASAVQSLPIIGTSGFEVRSALHELRRLSGLTWENLADILRVTRRSLHLWANGGPINSPNEKQIRDLLDVIRGLDRGTATENRQLLLTSLGDGRTLTDLLRNHEFDKAITFAGGGRGRQVLMRPDVSGSTPQVERVSVADMLGTNPERIHVDDGGYLPSRRRMKRV